MIVLIRIIRRKNNPQTFSSLIFIIEIERSFCIQRTIFIIDICFTVVPKNGLLAAFITKMNDLWTGRIDRFRPRSFIDFPDWSKETDITCCPFSFHIGQCDIIPVSIYFEPICTVCHPDGIITICLTKIKIAANNYCTAIQTHILSGISTPTIWRSGTKY